MGKWELIEIGPSEDKMQALITGCDYIEFLSTGDMFHVNSCYSQETIFTYQINSEYIYTEPKEDGVVGGGTKKYTLFDNDNKLKLVYVSGIIDDKYGTPRIFIYERIK